MVYRLLTELVALRLFAYSLAIVQTLVSVKSSEIKIMQRHSHTCTTSSSDVVRYSDPSGAWVKRSILPGKRGQSCPLRRIPLQVTLCAILSHVPVSGRAQKRTTSHFRPTQGVDDTIISAANPWVDHDFSLRGIHPKTTGGGLYGPILPKQNYTVNQVRHSAGTLRLAAFQQINHREQD